jgi:hypothetical protein
MPRDPRIAMWAIGLALAAGAAPAASLIPAAPTRAASTAVPLSAPIPDAQRAQVAIRNFAFQPAEGVFDSGALNQGDSFSFTFQQPGTYEYFCRLHPSMRGRILVRQKIYLPLVMRSR